MLDLPRPRGAILRCLTVATVQALGLFYLGLVKFRLLTKTLKAKQQDRGALPRSSTNSACFSSDYQPLAL